MQSTEEVLKMTKNANTVKNWQCKK